MKQRLKVAYIFSVLILIAIAYAKAQITDPGIDPDVPIDGGLSLLVAAGVGYGTKKLREKRKLK
jgi:hypothetical protein